MEESKNSEIYDVLVRISQGEEISNWEIERIDELISSVRFNSSAPGKSRVKITFDSYEDYWKLFDLTTDDIWFANAIYSHYDTYEFESSDWVDDDWNQGYIIREFSGDNLNKLKEILSIISPKHAKLNNDTDYEAAANVLISLFERQCDEIKWEYTNQRNMCKERGAMEMIESETCNAFQNYGIFSLGRCFYSYVTTVSVLLGLYKMVGDTTLNISEMLEKIGKDLSIGGQWYDYMYEQDCVDFDEESFHRDVDRNLDKIIDKLEEDENLENMKEFYQSVSKIIDKYDYDKWYETPKDNNVKFKITGINTDNKTILIAVNKNGKYENRSYDIETFNNLLYQPELFENRFVRIR